MTDNYSRRNFIAATSLAVGSAGMLAACGREPGQDSSRPPGSSNRLSLNAAGYHTKRVAALFDGRVAIEGRDSHFRAMAVGDMNTDVFNGPQTLDVTEIGLHPFMLAYANDGFRDYALLPIFPLRLFRHRSVFIRTDRGIEKPQDLMGKSIATPGYSSTSLTWIRGIFAEEYGVDPTDIDWVISAGDSSAALSGATSKQEQVTPEGVAIRTGPEGMDESDLLESGQVDALFHAVEPRAYIEGHPAVARLFADYRSAERAYFAKTGIFPIMHAVAIKRDLLREHPWLAEAVFNAYSQAKQLAYGHMAKAGWYDDMLPWYAQEFEETRELMGGNYYSYGVAANRKALDALFRYSYQQGLSSRLLEVDELLDPSSLELVEAHG